MPRTPAPVVALLVGLLCAGCMARSLPGLEGVLAPRVPDDGRLHAALTPVARVGGVSGFWQTPRGGAPGTTSPNRPTFRETGVTSSEELGLRAHVDRGRHRAWISYTRQRLAGEASLGQDLISQQSAFPAGTVVESDSAIDWLALGYNHLFELPLGGPDALELRPGLGLRAAQLHHVLHGSNGARVSRHHGPWLPNLELEWSWRPRAQGQLRFSGSVAQSLTLAGSGPQRSSVFELLGRMHYDASQRVSLFVETGYRAVELRDDQPRVQNHLDMQFGPWIGIGGSLGF